MPLVWKKYLGNDAEYCSYGDTLLRISPSPSSLSHSVDLSIFLNGNFNLISSFSDWCFSQNDNKNYPIHERMAALTNAAKEFADTLLVKV